MAWPCSGRGVVSVTTSVVRRWPRVLRLEWRLLAASRTTWLVASLFLLSSAAGLINGRANVQRLRVAAAAALTAQVEQHATLKRDLARAEEQRARAHVPQTRLQPGLPSAGSVEARVNTFRAALPPLATAVIGAGGTQRVPQRYEIRGGGGARFWPFGRTVGTKILSGLTPEQPMENPAAMVLGGFDLAYVTVYLYPLLVVALMYDVVSRDREMGTLALVAAQPITFRSWLTMRVAVRGAVIAVCGVLLPSIGIAGTMADWSGDALVRLGLWGTAVLGYSAIWTAFAVALSVTARASAPGAVIAVSAWLIVVIVVPALLRLSTPLLVPTSARLAYATEERAASLEINARVDAAIAALNQVVRTRFSGTAPTTGDHPTFTEPIEPPVEGDLLRFPRSRWTAPTSVVRLNRGFTEARRAHVEQRLAPVLAELDEHERREVTFFAATRYLSPALVLQAIAEDVAGTRPERSTSWLGQLDQYVRRRDAFFSAKALGDANVSSREIDVDLTPFRFREERVASLAGRMALPIAWLLSIAIALVALCSRATRRWRL